MSQKAPPFPGDACTVTRLYKYLEELANWVESKVIDDEGIPDNWAQSFPGVPEFPELSVYANLPVLTHSNHFDFLRVLRQAWDRLVRTFDDAETDAWDSESCANQRLMMYRIVVTFFNDAFTSYELREARANTEITRFNKRFDRIYKRLQKILESDDVEESEAEDEEYYDG